MVVTKDKVVSLTYELRENDQQGPVLEVVKNEKPMTFLYGAGNLLPKFEENLDGLKQGEKFQFLLESQDAYGDVDTAAIVDIPKSIFEKDGKVNEEILQVGNQIPMRDKEGNHFSGIVQEIGETTVKMDFNHPLAGTNLFFTGEVVDIREASDDELKHGHAHNPDSCGHCAEDDCSHKE
jgi:FKBP-type peptidyl-prolyl cis-trans isomerase SlyD